MQIWMQHLRLRILYRVFHMGCSISAKYKDKLIKIIFLVIMRKYKIHHYWLPKIISFSNLEKLLLKFLWESFQIFLWFTQQSLLEIQFLFFDCCFSPTLTRKSPMVLILIPFFFFKKDWLNFDLRIGALSIWRTYFCFWVFALINDSDLMISSLLYLAFHLVEPIE